MIGIRDCNLTGHTGPVVSHNNSSAFVLSKVSREDSARPPQLTSRRFFAPAGAIWQAPRSYVPGLRRQDSLRAMQAPWLSPDRSMQASFAGTASATLANQTGHENSRPW